MNKQKWQNYTENECVNVHEQTELPDCKERLYIFVLIIVYLCLGLFGLLISGT